MGSRLIILAVVLLLASPETSMSQAAQDKFAKFKYQLSREAMIDFSGFVGAEGEEREKLNAIRAEFRELYDASVYSDPARSWYQDAFLSGFIFAFDRAFYDYKTGRYKIDELLDDAVKEFGKYDHVVIWVSYPRLRIDERDQFDLHYDMPGCIAGWREVIDKAHARDVKVFIAYNPWDKESEVPEDSHAQKLARLARAIGADGIFLDTMAGADPSFTNTIGELNPNIVYGTEGMPSRIPSWGTFIGGWHSLAVSHEPSYWDERTPPPTTFYKARWLEPRYSLSGVNRDAEYLAPLIKYCFFHGYGYLVWENIFGWWNPMNFQDRALMKKCVFLLRQHNKAFRDMNWQAFIKTQIEGVYVNQWQDRQKTVYTIFNDTSKPVDNVLFTVEEDESKAFYDVWNGRAVSPVARDGRMGIICEVDAHCVGCVVAQPNYLSPPQFYIEPDDLYESFYRRPPSTDDLKTHTTSRPYTKLGQGSVPGMVHIPGGIFTMHVCHNVHRFLEGGCYGDMSTRLSKSHPSRTFYLQPYYIDRTEVTNEMYKEFLERSKYAPGDTTNFLKHWTKPADSQGKPWRWNYPEDRADHPVVWVDHADASAYADWAGKRLPLEEEWQYAAQGPQLYNWPWGNEFVPAKCNTNSSDTTPVDQFPDGASPFGCLDMTGNVWEWTYRIWDDGHCRFALLRGGSYFRVEGSHWFPASGAQPCQVHEKMLLMYPGLDRCANIGFRCVMDAKK